MARNQTIYYEAAGGVVIHRGQMLLLDRPERNEVRLPKGHLDPGETPEMAALREVAEESGYADLEIVQTLGDCDVEYNDGARHVVRTEHYFVMRLRSERTMTRSEKDAAQFRVAWTPLDEAPDRLTYAAEQARARAAIAAISAMGGE